MLRICLLTLLLFWPGLVWGQTVAEREQAVADLQAEIRAITERVEKTGAAQSRAAAELETTERELAQASARHAQARERLAASRARLETLAAERQTLRRDLAAQSERLSAAVKAAWKSRQQTPLKAWLAPGSLAESQRMARFYQMFNAQQLAQLQAFEQTEQQLSRNLHAQETQEQALREQQAELAGQRERLESRRQARETALAGLENEVASAQARLRRKTAEKAELEQLIEEMRAALDRHEFGAGAPLDKGRGQLSWPVNGKVVQAYGSTGATDDVRQEGITIAAPAGTTVRAVYPGQVVFADYLKGYGLLVIIDHGNQYMTLYGRNETLLRSVGEPVEAGAAIATVGETGGFRRTGLYFEVRRGGATQDPMSWLAAR